MRVYPGSRQAIGLLLALGALTLLVGQGCPIGGGGSVVVISPALDQTRVIGDLITVVYSAPGGSDVSAFYDRDGIPDTGDEVVFGNGLATGDNKFTQLATASLAPGPLFLGISAATGLSVSTEYATGRIDLVAGVTAAFVSPDADLTVAPGVEVPIEFNAGTGVSNFTYRVFYDLDGTVNGNEITIQQSSSTNTPVIQTTFNTSGLAPNVYFIGVTINSPVSGSTTVFAVGRVIVTSEAFVQLLSPLGGANFTAGTPIIVNFAAGDPSTQGAQVRVFFDLDTTLNNGNDISVGTVAAAAGTLTVDSFSIPAGAYYIGVQLLSVDPPLVSYSAAPILLSDPSGGVGSGGQLPGGTVLINLTAPARDVTIFEGQELAIRWSTPLQVGEGTVELFREPDFNEDDEPDGEPTRVVISPAGLDARTARFTWNTAGVRGRFFIGGTLTTNEGERETDFALGVVTIQPFMVWVGDLGTRLDEDGVVIPQSGAIQGATFRGHNVGDNLGSAMVLADDYDGDGIQEVILAAQFAKPFLLQQDGRGAGEAYFIYGRTQRYLNNVEVNNTGQASLPGIILAGVIPNPSSALEPGGLAGNSVPYNVEGQPAGRYATEGLRSITLVPDVDGDGLREIVFGFPFCNSLSLEQQVLRDITPAPLGGMGRLENNGHFLRGGVVMLASTTGMLTNRTFLSRNSDRVIQLHEVGQIFGDPAIFMGIPGGHLGLRNVCGADNDTFTFPCEGFWQDTLGLIEPPRLAEPVLSFGGFHLLRDSDGADEDFSCEFNPFNQVSLNQIDPPDAVLNNLQTFTGDDFDFCDDAFFLDAPFIQTVGTGFYTEGPDNCDERTFKTRRPPFGARVLGEVTSQALTGTTASRFGFSVSVSGDFLLIGAPLRTTNNTDILTLPTTTRTFSGDVYMLRMTNFWNSHEADISMPAPHNFIIEDVGYSTFDTEACVQFRPVIDVGNGSFSPVGGAMHNIENPFHVVGAASNDRIGDNVVGLGDINNDGVDDFAVGGEQTNGGRGGVYIIYRRQSELEADYLLERLQIAPTNLNRLNGMFIVGRPGERLGGAIAAGGDFNDDGFDDMLIGSPLATPGSGFQAGEVLLLFGGKNLLSPAGGNTIPQLRDSGDGMVFAGASANDNAGMTVANAGDVNDDGIDDILIAAPNGSPRYDSNGDGVLDSIGLDLNGDRAADDLDGDGAPDDMTGAGLVYVVLGGEHLTGTIGLSEIGTANLPGLVFVGRKGGDKLGGGVVQNGVLSRGVNTAGDLDGDGNGDVFVGSVLADPDGKTNAGEIYLMYGFDFPDLPPVP